MIYQAWIKKAAAGNNRLNFLILFLCSILNANPEPIIPPKDRKKINKQDFSCFKIPGSVQNATPRTHKPVPTILPINY
jgi:hypothetical protein